MLELEIPELGIYVREDGFVYNPRSNKGWFAGTLMNNGYLVVNIRGRIHLVHRLIAEAFIPNSENKEFVDHIDRNRLNNSVSNLRWVTRTENNNNQSSIDRAFDKWGYSPKTNRRRYGADWARENRRKKNGLH